LTPIVRLLLVANLAVFFVQSTMPAIADPLVFFPPYVLRRPWTPITYMFLHGGLMHLVFNMMALFFFGPRIEMRLEPARFLTLYFVSGLTGALLSSIFSFGSPIIGASAGVFGVMLAFAYFWPHEPIHIWGVIPVPARILVIITTVLSLWSGFGGGGSGVAHFAHLGGYLGAYVYLRWIERKRGQFRKAHDAAPSFKPEKVADWKRIDRTSLHQLNREELDRILDKINASGVGSLTPAERQFLSNFSPRDGNAPTVQ
jgi:membrane associated rhomboid family serine protease